MDFSTRINRAYPSLSEPEIQLINYIKTQNHQVIKMTSQELADHCFVSRTTVFRLLKKLDIDSFAELKYLLKSSQEAASQQETSLANIAIYYHLYIDQIFEKLKLAPIVDLFSQTQVLYLYGTGNEQKLAVEYMRQLFTQAGKKVIIIFDRGEFDYAKATFQPNDLLCILSYKGEREETLQMVHEANNLGVKTLAITRTSQNPLSQQTDYQLYVPTESVSVSTRRDYEISITFYFIIDRLFLAFRERRSP